ncbi:MAG: S-ribosylhomocysteine lyase [candidate division Zixibacteria bacterium]
MTPKTKIPDSFLLDHDTMEAPQVRKAGVFTGPLGEKISKFDLRLVKPNTECLPTDAIHTLEHLLATYMKEFLEGVIDISPMGCRTGFYLSIWGDIDSDVIKEGLIGSLKKVMTTEWADVPGTKQKECGNYRDHSLFGAKQYAEKALNGFGEK